jgi:hypothetical protein
MHTGTAAETLERLRNALNWSDPNVSYLFCAALAASGSCLSFGNYFSKVLCIVAMYRKCTKALTFENVWQFYFL